MVPYSLPSNFTSISSSLSSSISSIIPASISSVDFDPSLLELMYTEESSQTSIFNPHLTLDQLIEMAASDDVPAIGGSPINSNSSPGSTTSTDDENNNNNYNSVYNEPTSSSSSTPTASPSETFVSRSSSTPTITTTSPSSPTIANPSNNNNFTQSETNNNSNNTNLMTSMITNTIMSSIFNTGNNSESSPNFGPIIFSELSKIQKAIETITVLTQIQQQPLNSNNLAANTSHYPIALFSLTEPIIVQQCNVAFAQMLGYPNVHDAAFVRLDRLLPHPFHQFALRRIKKTGSNDAPKKLSHIVFQSQNGVDMIICVAVVKRINPQSCMMAVIKHARASAELRAEMSKFAEKVGVLSQAVQEIFHLKKSIKLGEVRRAPHIKDQARAGLS